MPPGLLPPLMVAMSVSCVGIAAEFDDELTGVLFVCPLITTLTLTEVSAVTCVEVAGLVAVTVTVLVTVDGSATGVNLMVLEIFEGESWTYGMFTEPKPLDPNAAELTITV